MYIKCNCGNDDCESYLSYTLTENHSTILMESKDKLPILIYPDKDDLFELYLELKKMFVAEENEKPICETKEDFEESDCLDCPKKNNCKERKQNEMYL